MKFILIIFSFCILFLAADISAQESSEPNTGRLNPFAKFQIIESQLAQQETPRAETPVYTTKTVAGNKPSLFVQTVVIKFLDAQNLRSVIENMLSPWGSIAVDKSSNSLIICDANEPLQKIVEQVKKIDKTPELLRIEVVIVDVQLDSDTDIGVNWDFLSDDLHTVTYRQNFTQRIGSTPETPETIGDATAFNSTGFGSDFSIVSSTVRNVVHLLQTKKKVEILASPTVLVVSGKSASVETVEEIPYQEQTDSSLGGGFASTQFKQVGVKLHVTATLTDDNDILMTIEPEQNTNTGVFGINNIPIIDTRKAKTDLLLKDGQVVIMGGLRRKESSKIRDQVPILGSLPLIGFFFGRDKVMTLNSELMVFLSPHIYKGQELAPEQMAKLKYARSLPSLPVNDDPNKSPLFLKKLSGK